ncbi:MAG: hypothetical protein IKE29_05075, partial [Paenibacillus sp.]|uniref:hypothetical protein n=1 Tax=Paenibacillus sp. TaxID=58172 RepID=UPI0025DD5326
PDQLRLFIQRDRNGIIADTQGVVVRQIPGGGAIQIHFQDVPHLVNRDRTCYTGNDIVAAARNIAGSNRVSAVIGDIRLELCKRRRIDSLETFAQRNHKMDRFRAACDIAKERAATDRHDIAVMVFMTGDSRVEIGGELAFE